jgi:esterase/lipase
MECNFCKKTFSSLYTLNNHKTTAKYCLKIQNKTITEKFKCEYCNKIFTSKYGLSLHTKTCKDLNLFVCTKDKDKDKDIIIAKQESIIEQLQKQEDAYKEQLQKQDEQIKELQDKLERLATTAISKPTSSTTNNNNTKILLLAPLDLSQERISNIVSTKLSGDHIVDGIAGLAKFVKDEIIKDQNGNILYNCVDSSRQMFKYKNENGDVIKDKNANKLIGAIQPALKEKTNDLYFEYGNKIENYVPDEEDRRNTFTKKDKYIFLKDTAQKINEDIADMHQNSKFSTELANQVTN